MTSELEMIRNNQVENFEFTLNSNNSKINEEVQNNYNKKGSLSLVNNSLHERKKSSDSTLESTSQIEELSQTSDSNLIFSFVNKSQSMNSNIIMEKDLKKSEKESIINYFDGIEKYYLKIMPKKFSDYKNTKNYISKNSLIKEKEDNIVQNEEGKEVHLNSRNEVNNKYDINHNICYEIFPNIFYYNIFNTFSYNFGIMDNEDKNECEIKKEINTNEIEKDKIKDNKIENKSEEEDIYIIKKKQKNIINKNKTKNNNKENFKRINYHDNILKDNNYSKKNIANKYNNINYNNYFRNNNCHFYNTKHFNKYNQNINNYYNLNQSKYDTRRNYINYKKRKMHSSFFY